MRLLIALALVFVLTGCASRGKLEQYGGTRVDLSQKNYRVIKAGAIGEDTGWSVLLCIFSVTSPEYAVAKARLYEGLNVEGRATGLANLTEDRQLLFFLLACRHKLTLSADIVEFTDQGTTNFPRRPGD